MDVLTSIPPRVVPVRRPVIVPRSVPFELDKSVVGCFVPETIGNNWGDISDTRMHGVVVGATISSKGRLGKAFKFDGNNDNIKITHNFNQYADLTFAFWVNFDDWNNDTQEYIFGNGASEGINAISLQKFSDNTLRFVFRDNSPSTKHIVTQDVSSLSGFHFIVTMVSQISTIDGTNYFDLYVDNDNSGTTRISNTAAWAPSGSEPDNKVFSTQVDTFFAAGLCDEILIFSKILNTEEMTNLYEIGRV